MTPGLTPDPDRLAALLDAFTGPDVGGTPTGGVSRPAASDADGAARRRFAETAERLGLAVRVDDVGNMYARREGTTTDALPVLIGSHLDTVVPGGRYDGILGVCIALETVALLNDAGTSTTRPIEVVNWTGEEGARFPPAMLGSGVVTGSWDAEYAHSRTDADGLRLGDELRRIGFLGRPENRIDAFFVALETHIEQGTRLEDADAHVGIVAGIDPVRWCTVTVTGPGGHAGGPGPSGRKDAMVAASRMVVAARDLSLAEEAFKTTVGRMNVRPGANNVIPHSVAFNLDVRSHEDAAVDHHLGRLIELFDGIAREEGVEVDVGTTWEMRGASFDDAVRDVLSNAARRREARWMELRGTIGHDSLHLAAHGPAAMLFTRTTAGLSHCEEEHAPWDAVLATAGVFADAVHELAGADELARRPAAPDDERPPP